MRRRLAAFAGEECRNGRGVRCAARGPVHHGERRGGGRSRRGSRADRWLDAVKKRGPILWIGPVLGGGKLIITSNDGRILAVSPANGAVMNAIDAGDPISVAPIIANGTLYVLTDAGDLKAYR